MSGRLVRIASRGSQLALWQAEHVRKRLVEAHPGLTVEIEVIRTTGDKILDVPLAKIGDRGLFTKEIDEALLARRADIAVHSLKDVSTRLPAGLAMAAIGEREDPRDVVLGQAGRPGTLGSLSPGGRVGTSSLRRRAQLSHLRPDLVVVDLRGNLNSRLEKLDSGRYDAIVLAAAGVLRLGWEARIGEYLDPGLWLPAVGQGALAMMVRADDSETAALLMPLHDPATASCVTAERTFLRSLEGGCQVPIGALATCGEDRIHLDGLVADLSGNRVLRAAGDAMIGEEEALGSRLAQELIAQGADHILATIRAEAAAQAPPAP